VEENLRYGRYEIVEQIGKGAMGVVYKAHDPQINRTVALKVLREDRVTSGDFVQRFIREAMAIGRLSHSNIVTVYDIGQDHGTVYIAMEFLEGVPLNDAIKGQDIDASRIADIAVQLSESLAYAHSKGIIHRDIKPSNIILTPSGQAKITDFGIAHIEDPEMTQQTQAGQILGTPVYMSPEQVSGLKLDGRSDLYSLSVILYEITAGRRPFTGDNITAIFKAITQDTPKSPSEINPEVPQEFSKLILKGMDKDSAKRYQTGTDMARAFKDYIRQQEAAGKQTEEQKKKPGMGMIIGVVILALMVIGIGVFFSRSQHQEQPRSNMGKPAVQAPVLTARVKMESVPEGAQVFIDNTLMGKTPIQLDIALGKHEVRMSLPEYHEWEAQIDLDKQADVPLTVNLEPANGGKPD